MRAAALLLSLACGLASAETITGVVVRVIDGDTLVVASQGKQINVRLARIDAPELGQPFGQEAKSALEGLTIGREVVVTGKPHDKYGRMLAEVRTKAGNVNIVLVRSGLAWAYRTDTQPAESSAEAAQAEATRAGMGLWAKPSIEPGDWRKGQR